ncbi:PAS domain-containing protein [Granulicella sp. L60]|uniref:PAS domain-containing protein n=1 Tax=Granulicella sp. L60 TaxID=1641866 RepID=UPI00131EAAE0|nr:PAS domain-containing protein [Granulicella sp. L60]
MKGTITLRRYGLAVISCVLATMAAFFLDAPASCFCFAIMVSSLYGGRGPGLLSIGLSGFIFDYLFLSPRFHLAAESTTQLRLFALLAIGLAIAILIEAKRRVEDRRVQIAAELQKSQSFLEEAQRISHVGSFGWTPVTNKLYWSAETLRIAGYDVSVIPTLELLYDRVHPEDRDKVKEILETSSQIGADLDFEHRFQLLDGTIRYIHVVAHAHRDEHGRFQYIGTVMDVSPIRQFDASLRASEFNFKLMVDSFPGQVFSLTPSAEVEHVNQEFLDYSGKTLEELRGWNHNELVHPDDRDLVAAAQLRTLETGEPFDLDHRLCRDDGVYRWFNVRGIALSDKNSGVLRCYNLLTDIDDRKKAEESTRARENTFRLIVDSIPGLVCTNTPTGELEIVNQPLLDYTGTTLEVLRTSWPALLHPEDRDGILELWGESVRTGGTLDVEFRLLRADGVYRWLHARVLPHYDVEGRIVRSYGLITDIEDRKRAERALKEAELRYRLVANSIPGLIYTTTAAGEMQFVNQKMQEFLGERLEAITVWTPYLHPDDVSKFTDLWRHSVETGDPFEAECRVRRADGIYRWLEVRGTPLRDADRRIVRWYNLASDIEARKRIEEVLLESEANLHLTINAIPGFVWSTRIDGEPEFYNQHYLDYLGITAAELPDLDWRTDVHPEDLPTLGAVWQSLRASGSPGECETRLRRFDGEYRWLLFRANPFRDAAGNILRWYGIAIDIDDRKRAEEVLRNTQSRLSRATQIATIGELAASIAHEINQPLAAVVSNGHACLRWLSADPPNISKAYETAEMLALNGKAASEVIQRLRSLFVRTTEIQRSAIDINDVISEALRLMRSETAKRNVLVKTDLDPALSFALGDRVQLQQVVFNLLLNGIEAMDSVSDRPRELFVRSKEHDRRSILVEISDSGIGIESPEKVFEAFFTTKPNGMGMGLTICRSIIEAHNGRLWAMPGQHHGTTFCFTLPVQTGGTA